MSVRLSSLRGKHEPDDEEISTSKNKNSTTTTELNETTDPKEDTLEEVDLKKDDSDSTQDSHEEEKKKPAKGKQEESDNADGYDPFSQESLRPLMNANQYSMRKTASQALMDVALMMANISQLRTLLTSVDTMEYSVPLIVMVSLSLGLQVLFAILISIIWMRESEHHQKDEYLNALREVTEATKEPTEEVKGKMRNHLQKRRMSYQGHILTSHLNYITMVLVFTITVVNMFVTGFGIKLESSTNTSQKTSTS